MTTTQEFLRQHYAAYYADRHRYVEASGEADMINSYVPVKYPFCGSEKFKRVGELKSAYSVI